MTKSFIAELDSHKRFFEKKYPSILKKITKKVPPELREALFYSLDAGGKRLRPVFILESSRIAGLDQDAAIHLAISVECLHTYSLIHDDLPAMDNDDYRRGRKTSHKVFGEDAAILAGDALHAIAYTLLAKAGISHPVMEYFSLASGIEGMISGQFLDIHSDENPNDEKLLKQIQKWKTGKLIEYSIAAPFIESRNRKYNFEKIREIKRWAQKNGELFQMIDDLLDFTGSQKDLGKTPGKDAEQNKLTYLSVYGHEKTLKKASSLSRSLSKEAAALFPESVLYRELPQFILSRNN